MYHGAVRHLEKSMHGPFLLIYYIFGIVQIQLQYINRRNGWKSKKTMDDVNLDPH